MKQFLTFLLLIVFSNFYAQNSEKTLIIKDAITGNPIVEATVLIMKTKQIFVSNASGEVKFTLKGASNIQIMHPAYNNLNIKSINLKDIINTFNLKSNISDLDEIVITKQHPQKILKNLIENSKNRLTTPARLKIYCREFFKMNDKYSYYNDGLINFQILGKNKKFDTNILVEQNRSIGLINEDVTSDVLGYNLKNIMENYYNFKYLNPVLEPKAKKEYDFLIKVYSKNKDYNLIIISPTDDSGGLLDDFTILYDNVNKLIIEVSSKISNNTFSKVEDKKSIGSKNIFNSVTKNIYRFDNNNYYLISSREEIGFNKIEKNETKKIEVRNYFVTNNFSTQNYSFKPEEVFKEKTLFNKKNLILSNYWSESGLTATTEEQEIINDIEE
ncbi:MAG: hypothetical protein H7174_13955 [Flavobacterium sp.]|nr:hypothetical protein [Flavobacterium sp.]